jgi:hypothetical protein
MNESLAISDTAQVTVLNENADNYAVDRKDRRRH